MLFALSRWVEMSLFPYAVILQVTPIVAIAPLILICVEDHDLALLICAWIVAFFPILSNTAIGLNERRPQPARPVPALQAPRAGRSSALSAAAGALPYFLGGLQIAGGLA